MIQAHTTRNHDQGSIRKIGTGDACQGIGEAGSGGYHGHARLAGHFAPGLGHEQGRLFMTCIEEGDIRILQILINRSDMPTAERKNFLDTARHQSVHHQFGTCYRFRCHN